jgi:hypothetical protein
MKVSTENDNNFGYEKIKILVDNIPLSLTFPRPYIFWNVHDSSTLCQNIPENCENRNDPDLVQAFLKKWWVESDLKAPNLPLSLRFKGSV